MLDIDSGSIFIDGVNIALLSRSHIRSALNTIPQQAFFLYGSVRLNVNPLEDLDDGAIIDALREVNLWTHIEGKGGLDTEMSEDLLSHGQQQLFCLARALCKSSQVVIMDEATSRLVSLWVVLPIKTNRNIVWIQKPRNLCRRSFASISAVRLS